MRLRRKFAAVAIHSLEPQLYLDTESNILEEEAAYSCRYYLNCLLDSFGPIPSHLLPLFTKVVVRVK